MKKHYSDCAIHEEDAYPKCTCGGYTPKNQDTQAEGMERIVRLVRDKIFPFGIWHDHPAGYERRVEMIVKVLMQEIAAAERRIAERVISEIPEGWDYHPPLPNYLSDTTILKQHLTSKFLTPREDK